MKFNGKFLLVLLLLFFLNNYYDKWLLNDYQYIINVIHFFLIIIENDFNYYK